jgi:hypothetical protein
MKEKEVKLIKKLLGNDIFKRLEKSEISGGILKLNTNTATSPEEIKTALQIVPRSILTYLFMNLKHRQVGDVIDLELPFANASLHANKLSPDNYSGEVIKDGKKLAEFKYRSLPGVGLILMSSLELYDVNQLDEIKSTDYHSENALKLQDIIDERIKMYDLVQSVVDRKLMEKDALKEMIRQRLTQELFSRSVVVSEPVSNTHEDEPMQEDKKNKLKKFLEEREKKQQETLVLDKKEICCPDCGHILYKGEDRLNLCICYGEHAFKNIRITKNDGGSVSIKFPKKFDIENISMLLDALKGRGL